MGLWTVSLAHHIQSLLAKVDLLTHPAVTHDPQHSSYICLSDPDNCLPPSMAAWLTAASVVVYCCTSSGLTRDCPWPYHAVALLFWPLHWPASDFGPLISLITMLGKLAGMIDGWFGTTMGMLAGPPTGGLVSCRMQLKQNETCLIVVFFLGIIFSLSDGPSILSISGFWEVTHFHQWRQSLSLLLLHIQRKGKHLSSVISWFSSWKCCHYWLMSSSSLWSCFDWGLDIMIVQLCLSTHCCNRNHTPWIETDGNNLQPLADGSCSIDPIALIKVVYRENTATNDGWLLEITQNSANITPLFYGVLTQSMKIIHNPGYFYTLTR